MSRAIDKDGVVDIPGLSSWPLVLVFGNYRGRGKVYLQELTEYLRERGIRAQIALEYGQTVFKQPSGMDDDVYNLKLSLECVDRCDIAVFVFFRAGTVEDTENVESFDQGVMAEYKHFCLQEEKKKTPALLIFDSKERRDACRSLFRGLTKCREARYGSQAVIEESTPHKILEEIKKEVFGFCLGEYADYAAKYRTGFHLSSFTNFFAGGL